MLVSSSVMLMKGDLGWRERAYLDRLPRNLASGTLVDRGGEERRLIKPRREKRGEAKGRMSESGGMIQASQGGLGWEI